MAGRPWALGYLRPSLRSCVILSGKSSAGRGIFDDGGGDGNGSTPRAASSVCGTGRSPFTTDHPETRTPGLSVLWHAPLACPLPATEPLLWRACDYCAYGGRGA